MRFSRNQLKTVLFFCVFWGVFGGSQNVPLTCWVGGSSPGGRKNDPAQMGLKPFGALSERVGRPKSGSHHGDLTGSRG
jgi:hypothetical protein